MGQQCSVIIATRDRASSLRETLRQIPAGLETLVVDNASGDRTAQVVREARPDAAYIRLDQNLGPAAKQIALERASGEFVVALDDDCAPEPWAWEAMLARVRARPEIACAGFGVRLPDGRWECGALPCVFVGAAVCFRREALLDAGGYDRRLFMQAEEYDIVFRLMMRGHRCEVFHDLPATHRKSPDARRPARTVRLDARNNIWMARRYLPAPWASRYAREWTRRYLALGRVSRAPGAARRGVRQARLWSLTRRGERMTPRVFDDLFGLSRIESAMRDIRARGAQRVLLASLGKNIEAYAHGARLAGLTIAAIADDAMHRGGYRWREGAPVLTREQAMAESFDAVVVSNSAPIFAHREAERWRSTGSWPVFAPEAVDADALLARTRTGVPQPADAA